MTASNVVLIDKEKRNNKKESDEHEKKRQRGYRNKRVNGDY